MDVSALPDTMETSAFKPEVIADTIVPSENDNRALLQNISTVVSRVLVSYLGYFKFTFEKDVNWHFEHQFSQEMSQQSTFVSDP